MHHLSCVPSYFCFSSSGEFGVAGVLREDRRRQGGGGDQLLLQSLESQGSGPGGGSLAGRQGGRKDVTPAGQSVGRPCGASVKWTTSPCLTHSLCGQHVIDGVVVLLGQDGQLTGLLILQPLQHGLVVRLGRVLQKVVAQRLVLTGLDLARVLELALYLQLFGLREGLGRKV